MHHGMFSKKSHRGHFNTFSGIIKLYTHRALSQCSLFKSLSRTRNTAETRGQRELPWKLKRQQFLWLLNNDTTTITFRVTSGSSWDGPRGISPALFLKEINSQVVGPVQHGSKSRSSPEGQSAIHMRSQRKDVGLTEGGRRQWDMGAGQTWDTWRRSERKRKSVKLNLIMLFNSQ